MCSSRHPFPYKKLKYIKGMYIRDSMLTTIHGNKVDVPDKQHLIHIQFRRFAGCPVCNLHLQSFLKRREEICNNNIREIIIFHSDAKELLKYTADLPFAIVADPEKSLYRQYGVQSSVWSLVNIKVLIPVLRAIKHSLLECIRYRKPFPPIRPKDGSFGLPADFLIAHDAKIIDCYYGQHADDQWSVDELLHKARLSSV